MSALDGGQNLVGIDRHVCMREMSQVTRESIRGSRNQGRREVICACHTGRDAVIDQRSKRGFNIRSRLLAAHALTSKTPLRREEAMTCVAAARPRCAPSLAAN